jgi:flagellin-specific chaperone FliS
MLKTAPLQDLDSIYDLFTKLPVNENLRNDFKNLDKVSGTKSPEQKQAAWSELLDPSSTFRLMYCISIIKDI